MRSWIDRLTVSFCGPTGLPSLSRGCSRLSETSLSVTSSGLKPARWKKARTARACWSTDCWTEPRSVALVGEVDRPGREVGGDVALRNAAHRDRPVLGHLRTAKPVAQRVAAGGESKRKNRHRAQKDGAAVLQLLDHGMETRAFVRIYEQPPVTIAGHGCDEPCIYSDELSETK